MDQLLLNTNDLGEVDCPLLICGGAYSNVEALEALLDVAGKLGFSSDTIIHTGDVIAYCASPSETGHLLKSTGLHAIQGNVEESLGLGSPDCGCGFEEGSACNVLAQRWYAHADSEIDDELRRWMSDLPHHLTFTMAGQTVRVIHGSVLSINEYIYESSDAEVFESELDRGGSGVILAGHSGLPFTRHLGRRVWHNSGALGMPANDGTPRAWFSTVTPRNGEIEFRHHALDYDFESSAMKMLEANLPVGYADALTTGLWPSLDSLPKIERSKTGTPLDPVTKWLRSDGSE